MGRFSFPHRFFCRFSFSLTHSHISSTVALCDSIPTSATKKNNFQYLFLKISSTPRTYPQCRAKKMRERFRDDFCDEWPEINIRNIYEGRGAKSSQKIPQILLQTISE